MNDELTERKVYCKAYDYAEPLDTLVSKDEIPSDPDKLSEQVHDSVERTLSVAQEATAYHNNLNSLIEEYSRILYRDSLPRIGMEHLVYDNESDAVRNGIWPDSMNKWDCLEVLEDMDVPNDCWNEAYETVSSGLYDGTHPEESNRYE